MSTKMPDKEAIATLMQDFALRSALLAWVICLLRMTLYARSGPLRLCRVLAEGSLCFFVGYGFAFLPGALGWPPESGQFIGTIIGLFGIDWMKEKLDKGINVKVGIKNDDDSKTDYQN